MAEISLPWDDVDIGDALTYAPYNSDRWNQMYRAVFAATGSYGVQIRHVDGLEITLDGGDDSPATLAAGAALVAGQFYENTLALEHVIPRPISSTRYDRIVIRRTWATKLSRSTRVAGTEGGGAPAALVQILGTTWDIPIAIIQVPTAGAMTLTDDRVYRSFPDLMGRQGGLDDDWDFHGATNYLPGKVKMYCGQSAWIGGAAGTGTVTVTFPAVFAKPPMVIVTQRQTAGVIPLRQIFGVTATAVDDFNWSWTSAEVGETFAHAACNWIAIGEE